MASLTVADQALKGVRSKELFKRAKEPKKGVKMWTWRGTFVDRAASLGMIPCYHAQLTALEDMSAHIQALEVMIHVIN